MSQCLNPQCLQVNPDDHKFCSFCRAKLFLGNRYRVVKYIGEGAFGRTFLAVDTHRLDSSCVIKQFLPLSQGKAFDLFKQEAQLLMNLQMRGLVDNTSDLYALAVCAIRMLTGCLPEEKTAQLWMKSLIGLI